MVNSSSGPRGDELEKPLLRTEDPHLAPEQSTQAVKQLGARTVLFVLCGVAFTSNVVISLIAPILPVHFKYVGMSQIWCGVMFSCFPMAMLLFSPIAVKAMARYGRALVLFFGLVLQGISSVTFGYADELTGGTGANKTAALVVYTLSRLACGAGGSCANNAIFSIAADRFPDSLAKVMGLNEVVIGVGFSLGPPIGTAIFLKLGFNIVFLSSGMVILLFAPFSLLLWQPRTRHHASVVIEENQGGLFEVLTPGLLWAGLCVFLGTGVFGVVEPILGLYLTDEVGVHPAAVGSIFAVFAVAYSLGGFLAGVLADRVGAMRVVTAGNLAGGLTMLLLLGPTASLFAKGTPERIWYEVAVLVILGVTQSGLLIPSLPAMKDSVPGSSPRVTECVVAWFNMFLQLGLVVGPLLGTAFSTTFGFEATVAGFGAAMVAYGFPAMVVAFRTRAVTGIPTPVNIVTGTHSSPRGFTRKEVTKFEVPSI